MASQAYKVGNTIAAKYTAKNLFVRSINLDSFAKKKRGILPFHGRAEAIFSFVITSLLFLILVFASHSQFLVFLRGHKKDFKFQ